MHTINKKFSGYPFAHRQHTHSGHCKLIHGHNWDFEIFLEAEELDENGFVYDFGKFGWLKDWLKDWFDHTLVISKDDPLLPSFKEWNTQRLCKLVIVDSCSSEGIAKLVYNEIEERLKADENDRVCLVAVRVHEDHKNSAFYEGK